MSVVVVFQGKDDWFIANWIFRRLLQDIRERFQPSPEEEHELNSGQYMHGLFFGDMLPDIRGRILHMMKTTIIDIINDKDGKYIGNIDENSYQVYRNALPRLLNLIEKYENLDWPPEIE
jgi:hypothetical protein